MMDGVCPSVCLSVAWLDLTRERKCLGSPKLAGWKLITRINREPIYMSKVTRPINDVTDNAPYGGRGHYNFLKTTLLRHNASIYKKTLTLCLMCFYHNLFIDISSFFLFHAQLNLFTKEWQIQNIQT